MVPCFTPVLMSHDYPWFPAFLQFCCHMINHGSLLFSRSSLPHGWADEREEVAAAAPRPYEKWTAGTQWRQTTQRQKQRYGQQYDTCSLVLLCFFLRSSGIIVCCLHLKIVFRSCPRGRQWWGIFHYRWWTAAIKQKLLFSPCKGCFCRTLPFTHIKITSLLLDQGKKCGMLAHEEYRCSNMSPWPSPIALLFRYGCSIPLPSLKSEEPSSQ